MRIYKIALRVAVSLSLIVLIVLAIILVLTSSADQIAMDVLNEDYAKVENKVIILEPEEAVMNLVFYQGGLVQTEAYLVLLDALRDSGIRVFVPKMPLNLAILNRQVIDEIYSNYGDDLPWVLMGHSLGGATLSFVADERFEALIFLAAYPANSEDLSTSNIKILSITASNDDVLNWDNFENTKALLPEDTIFFSIEGGNHANFGHYGKQRGDGEATITKQQQISLTIEKIIKFLEID